MIKCPSCGRELPDAAKFCAYCGSALHREAKKASGKIKVKVNVPMGMCGTSKCVGEHDMVLPANASASQLLNDIGTDLCWDGQPFGFYTGFELRCPNGTLSSRTGGGDFQTLWEAGVKDGDVLTLFDVGGNYL